MDVLAVIFSRLQIWNYRASGIAEVTALVENVMILLYLVSLDNRMAVMPRTRHLSLCKSIIKPLGTGRAGISEAYIYDATNIRLRNVSLTYSFPSSLLKKTPIQRLKLGVSVNNVWMIKSNLNGIDPESVYATSTNATGMENASAPTSRTYLFNVTLGF